MNATNDEATKSYLLFILLKSLCPHSQYSYLKNKSVLVALHKSLANRRSISVNFCYSFKSFPSTTDSIVIDCISLR